MARRRFETHPLTRNGRVGFAPMDIQTLHEGHVILLGQMAQHCESCIVGIGSVRRHGVDGHPFTFEQRKEMVQAVFGDRFQFVELDDIDAAADNDEWVRYVLKKIIQSGLPMPTDCFVGSPIDAKRWYAPAFGDMDKPPLVRPLSAVYSRSVKADDRFWDRQLHVVDRSRFGTLSGREIRAMIEARDPAWMAHVPAVLHRYVEWNYPPHLRVALRSYHPPSPADYPVGTRYRGRWNSQEPEAPLLELKDDGMWRPVRTHDEKADHARQARESNTTKDTTHD